MLRLLGSLALVFWASHGRPERQALPESSRAVCVEYEYEYRIAEYEYDPEIRALTSAVRSYSYSYSKTVGMPEEMFAGERFGGTGVFGIPLRRQRVRSCRPCAWCDVGLSRSRRTRRSR